MRNILEQQYIKDIFIVIAMVVAYNICFIFPHFNWEYINTAKIIWMFLGGGIIFIQLYAILHISLKYLNSNLLFLIISFTLWIAYPILFHFIFHGSGSNLTYRINGQDIYSNGDLTVYGYLHNLKNYFIFLALYAAVLFALHIRKKFERNQNRELAK